MAGRTVTDVDYALVRYTRPDGTVLREVPVRRGEQLPDDAPAAEVKRLEQLGAFGAVQESSRRGSEPPELPDTPFPTDGAQEEQVAWLESASVKQVLAVAEQGDDEMRAALLAAEESRGDTARKTLLDRLSPS